MKKIILGIAALVIILTSCSKETLIDCNCGLVLSDDISNYSVVIRNDCSGNEKTFILSPGDWMNAYVGSDYCINNVASW
jgi:hypothetical protein